MVCGGCSQFFWAPMYGGMTWDVPPGSMISRSGVTFKDLVVADAVGGGRWSCGKVAPRFSVLYCFLFTLFLYRVNSKHFHLTFPTIITLTPLVREPM